MSSTARTLEGDEHAVDTTRPDPPLHLDCGDGFELPSLVGVLVEDLLELVTGHLATEQALAKLDHPVLVTSHHASLPAPDFGQFLPQCVRFACPVCRVALPGVSGRGERYADGAKCQDRARNSAISARSARTSLRMVAAATASFRWCSATSALTSVATCSSIARTTTAMNRFSTANVDTSRYTMKKIQASGWTAIASRAMFAQSSVVITWNRLNSELPRSPKRSGTPSPNSWVAITAAT